MTILGQVAALWRYPVKSMQGEAIDATFIEYSGLIGDRAYALRDMETGHIVSAKHPRRWEAVFACRAVYHDEPRPGEPLPAVEVTLPDGATVNSADPQVHQRLSTALGRTVRLVTVEEGGAQHTREADRSPLERLGSGDIVRQEALAVASSAGLFFDYAPLHLLSTATLDALSNAYPDGDFNARRFRPNIVVATATEQQGFVENGWIGRELAVGDEVQLAVIDPCPRCIITTLAQNGLAADPGILRTIHRSNAATSVTAVPGDRIPAVAGVYARAERHGSIHLGDSVTLSC